MSAVIGFSGSLISLAMSKSMAKRSMGVQVIEQPRQRDRAVAGGHGPAPGRSRPASACRRWASSIAAEPNAFATGMNRNNALVAVSTGLLQNMSADEVEAVLGHEVTHVANGDMVTMALIQGVVNTFVIFLSRVVGHVVDRVVFKTERGYGPAYYITSIVAQIVLSILATMIVMWFSRRREFRADAGGATLAGRQQDDRRAAGPAACAAAPDLPGEFAAFGISGGMGAGIKRLFMSHPPLEERIAALREGM